MKTEKEINQVKTLKSLIAEMVAAHKTTKSIARKSSKSEDYSSSAVARAQMDQRAESDKLFIAYAAYYVLRHGVEDIDTYAEALKSQLRAENHNRSYPTTFFGAKFTWSENIQTAIKRCIECLNWYLEEKDGK